MLQYLQKVDVNESTEPAKHVLEGIDGGRAGGAHQEQPLTHQRLHRGQGLHDFCYTNIQIYRTYSNLFQFTKCTFDQISQPVGKEVRWSSMQGHMLQLSGLEGGGRCGSGSLGAGGILSPGSSPPGSGLSPVQLFFDDSQ